MAVLESRQVVAWSIPTLALLVSLLWLRRRYHNRDPPTSDPGGFKESQVTEKKDTEEEEEQKLESFLEEESQEFLIKDLTTTQEEASPFIKKEEVEVEENSHRVSLQIEKVEEKKTVKDTELNGFKELLINQHPDSAQEFGFISSNFEETEDEKIELTEIETKIVENRSFVVENIVSEGEPVKEPLVVGEIGRKLLEDSLTSSTILIESAVGQGDTGKVVILNNQGLTNQKNCESKEEFVPSQSGLVSLDVESSSSAFKELNSCDISEISMAQEPITMEQVVLEEKLASLVLDTMKINDDEAKQNSERDSANQSPSEVMLASPSISNFSDAHSEGSSDSGKGHSDVATSPSRTPAGGSSLAGDSAFSVYEFVLPQVMVGRLIGRHGSFIHEIRTSTHTNIFIKRHPDTNKLKICAIEGTQQDIDKALAKIRQKFPLRRFPKLTLEKVSFVSINNTPPLKPEDFHLSLVEGVNNDVVLSSLISAAHFFLQQPSHPTYSALSRLNQVMNTVYSNAEAPLLETPVKDAICAAPTMGGWYRAQIVSVNEANQKCDVRFVDYGGYLTLDTSYLRQIRGDLLMLPFQAVECYLANVAPAGDEGWTEEARLVVQTLTHGQLLQAQIYDYAEDGTPLVYLYSALGSQIILVNEELVARGYAAITTPPEE